MQYKTIVHELLMQRPKMCAELRKNRQLLTTLERYAKELKVNHEAWQKMLVQLRPGSDPQQIKSEAMEIAMKEMEDRLPSASKHGQDASQVLDAAMLFLRRPTRRG